MDHLDHLDLYRNRSGYGQVIRFLILSLVFMFVVIAVTSSISSG